MRENIKGKVIVITGASSGMGEAAARYLAKQGGRVVLAARRAERIDVIANDINGQGGEALAQTTDVTRLEDVKKLVDTAVAKWGRIDVLINNAGVMPLSSLDQAKVNEWDMMIDVNLRGVLHGIAAALPIMKAQQSGHIINTASVAGHLVFPTSAVYSATKFAVRALTEGLRKEASTYNVRATIISPGAVSTELLDHISDKDVQAANQDYVGKVGIPPETYARMVAFAIGEPEDVGVNEIIFRPTAQEL
ncbi:SDR family oxidoreductase [Citrobacter sedlakii]|uniref:SDR family oxidoreductase n=1 Tax=Citrobacter sedlakii TaxID=67826 RepID=A0ABS0ZTE4_9ENTR|nr:MULTISPECIES: SDR family oxidoreductase [Citrobacter]EHG7613720.1 SDR family oxidoreductase [Citrobacter sedlakii]KSY33244.1 oxidoreductase [Citrobacter sp. 50677481]MBJ8381644.1 SDR family oxidoreductase [Citrobacter sedlakii]MDM2750235.1 SDR family oxidoreductase [Citrobacter sp. Cs237]HBU8852283.1 SDR family oxidoreductase [Citrobacter sedlakii]